MQSEHTTTTPPHTSPPPHPYERRHCNILSKLCNVCAFCNKFINIIPIRPQLFCRLSSLSLSLSVKIMLVTMSNDDGVSVVCRDGRENGPTISTWVWCRDRTVRECYWETTNSFLLLLRYSSPFHIPNKTKPLAIDRMSKLRTFLWIILNASDKRGYKPNESYFANTPIALTLQTHNQHTTTFCHN